MKKSLSHYASQILCIAATSSLISCGSSAELIENEDDAFEGFFNYGSPIDWSNIDEKGEPVKIVITESRIEMPVFSTMKPKTK